MPLKEWIASKAIHDERSMNNVVVRILREAMLRDLIVPLEQHKVSAAQEAAAECRDS